MTIRVDEYSPSWVMGIIDDLEAGTPGREAVQSAVTALERNAEGAARDARTAEEQARQWKAMRGHMICAETMERQYTETALDARHLESEYRRLADGARKLRGELIPIARLLR